MRYTQQNLQEGDDKATAASDACAKVGARLSRFLDNDLSAEAATDVAAHISGCESCRREHDALIAIRGALRSLPTPESSVVRDRVFTRLERAARVTAAEQETANPKRRLKFSFGWLRGGSTVGLSRAFATIAVAGIVTGGALLLRGGPAVDVGREVGNVRGAAQISLPAPNRMETLFQLHDARAEAVAQVSAESPAATGSPTGGGDVSTANSEADRTNGENDESGGTSAKPSISSESDSSGSNSGSSSDEVPEAL